MPLSRKNEQANHNKHHSAIQQMVSEHNSLSSSSNHPSRDNTPPNLRTFDEMDCHLLAESHRKFAFKKDCDIIEVSHWARGKLNIKAYDEDGWEYFSTRVSEEDIGEMTDIYEQVFSLMEKELNKQTLPWYQADKNMFPPGQRSRY